MYQVQKVYCLNVLTLSNFYTRWRQCAILRSMCIYSWFKLCVAVIAFYLFIYLCKICLFFIDDLKMYLLINI